LIAVVPIAQQDIEQYTLVCRQRRFTNDDSH
jgi:hypothetical protein